MERAQVASRMTTFLVLLYSVYMAALVIGGAGLWFGVLPGDAPVGVTLVPAAFGAAVIGLALALPHLGGALQRFNRIGPAAAALGEGVRTSLRLVRRGDPGIGGALLWWAGDVAVLWASFEAFGDSPAIAVVVMAYFVGMLANTLPLPGGVGGVDGGMIGALIAFGVEPSLAVVAVLAYRGFAFWLPIAPGVIAWVSLRRTVAGWERDSAMIAPCPPSSPSAPATSAARSSSTSSRRAGTAPRSRAATTRSLPCASGAR
jgi:uncharacterized membrane protein YbhN (UPF0104 family)